MLRYIGCAGHTGDKICRLCYVGCAGYTGA